MFHSRRLIQITVSITLLGVLVYWIEVDQVGASLVGANFTYIALALCVVTVNRLVMTLKWSLLLKAKGINISYSKLIRIYYISNFLGLYLPATIGGDAVRVYYTVNSIDKGDKDGLVDIISSILLERFLGMAALFLFGLGSTLAYFSLLSNAEISTYRLLLITIAGVCSLGIAGFFISLSTVLSEKVLCVLAYFQHNQLLSTTSSKIEKLYRSYLEYKTKKITLVLFFSLTCVEIFTVVLWSYLVATAVEAVAPFIYFCAFLPIVMVLIRLPISLDGLGILEGSFAYFLSLAGVSETLGFSAGIANHIVVLTAILPGVLFYALWKRPREVAQSNRFASLS